MPTLPGVAVKALIYESANSLVYRAIREQDNQPIILKVLKEDYPTPQELARYRTEYEIAKSLNLTGVVKVYDLQKYQNTLYTERLLEFDFQTLEWQWKLEQIQAISFTDNVVEFMAGKIQKLPENTQTMLKLVACIGNQLALKTLDQQLPASDNKLRLFAV